MIKIIVETLSSEEAVSMSGPPQLARIGDNMASSVEELDQSVIEILDSSEIEGTLNGQDADDTFESVETADDESDTTWNQNQVNSNWSSDDASDAHFCNKDESSATFCSNMFEGCAFVLESIEPKSYQEALNCLYNEKCIDSMDSEMLSLEKNQTWNLVDLPKGRKVIDNK